MIYYADKYKVYSLPYPDKEYEVLNELLSAKRCDSNCMFHTRFLFEMDNTDLEEQCEYLKKNKTVIRRAVFSGKKSIHMIIQYPDTYEDFCKDNYREIWEYINNSLFDGKCDSQCRNPSRLTRRPGVMRADTGKEQILVYQNDDSCTVDDFYQDTLVPIRQNKIRAQKRAELRRRYCSYLPKHDGCDCSKFESVRYYLDTPFPLMSGNGNSSISLFKAIKCCQKYNDDRTLYEVIAKARAEGWSNKEIEHKLK